VLNQPTTFSAGSRARSPSWRCSACATGAAKLCNDAQKKSQGSPADHPGMRPAVGRRLIVSRWSAAVVQADLAVRRVQCWRTTSCQAIVRRQCALLDPAQENDLAGDD